MFLIKDQNLKKVLLLIAVFVVFFSGVRILMHHNFQNHAYDDGYNDNLIWNTLQNRFFWSDIKGYSTFGDHLDPILLIFLPFYFFGLGPRILFIFQTLFIGLGALPIYWLTKEKVKDPSFLFLLPLAYLLYIPIVNITFQGFYQIALAITPLLFAFYYLLNDKYKLFFVWLLIALLCQEDVALIAAFFGLYIFFSKQKKMLGLLLFTGGIALFLVDLLLIIPAFKGTSYTYLERYGYLGQSLPEMGKTMLTQPFYVLQHIITGDKILYVFGLFLPVAFLSFFAPAALIPAIPAIAQNLLSTYRDMYQLGTRYPSATVPFVFIAAVLGLARILPSLQEKRIKLIKRTMIFCMVLSLLYFFLGFFFRYTVITEPVKEGHEVIKLIPKNASISILGNLYPHLAHREHIWLFPKNWEKADYIVLMKLDPTWPISGDYTPTIEKLKQEKNWGKLLEFTFLGEVPRAPMEKQEYQNWFNKIIKSPLFKKVIEKKYYILLKRKGSPKFSSKFILNQQSLSLRERVIGKNQGFGSIG